MSDNCAVPPDRRFQKGRAKTGGRKKGDKYNAIRKDLADKLRDLNFDPVIEMVKIFKSRDCPVDIQAKICVDLLQYLHPKRKAVEHTGADGGPIDIVTVKRIIGVPIEDV